MPGAPLICFGAFCWIASRKKRRKKKCGSCVKAQDRTTASMWERNSHRAITDLALRSGPGPQARAGSAFKPAALAGAGRRPINLRRH